MKLSIITINLNDKVGLQKTIDSVLCQTFTDYEYIVIDGGSTDGSIDLIEGYGNKISYWISEKDSGIYNAMNKGIRKAGGEYCYFLNAGDIFANADALISVFVGDPHESFICGNFITDRKGVLTNENPYKGRDWSFALYDIYFGDLCHQAFFIKRDNFSKYELYKEDLRITSDWRLFFIAIGIHHESVLYVNVDIVIYNMEGLSSQIGGTAIYEERKRTASEVLPIHVFQQLDRLYCLNRDSYIIDIIQSRKWINNGFRLFCKIGRMLGFVKS